MVTFRVLSRYQQRRPPVSAVTVALRVLSVGISLVVNVVCAALLYAPVMTLFNINTDGFMNMSGIVTLAVIWLVVCVLALIILANGKALWGHYYRTLRTAQVIFILLPLLVVLVFLFAAALK